MLCPLTQCDQCCGSGFNDVQVSRQGIGVIVNRSAVEALLQFLSEDVLLHTVPQPCEWCAGTGQACFTRLRMESKGLAHPCRLETLEKQDPTPDTIVGDLFPNLRLLKVAQ